MTTQALKDLVGLFHPEALKILLVLAMSSLLGLERERRKQEVEHYIFGGIRTFPLIGLLGYGLALVAKDAILPVAAGLAVIGAFLLVSYRHKLTTDEDAGVTTEISGLLTYVIGVLVFHDFYWISVALVVISMLLLELKLGLEDLSRRLPHDEIVTFTKFLLLTVVILPAVPNQDFTVFRLNPFKTWLVVAAVSAISYASYVLQVVTKRRGGIVLAALLGGAYSSTMMTVVLARRARRENRPHLFAGSIVMASGMMYLRLAILLAIFSHELLVLLGPLLLVCATAALLGGLLWSRRRDDDGEAPKREYVAKNPLELRSALMFAAIFVALLVATGVVLRTFGTLGVFAMSVVMGLIDVDPFVLGLTQTAGTTTPLVLAATAIALTAASNNLAKGFYAFGFADRATGREAFAGLLLLTLVGLAPLLVLTR
jgi:uncharacterized membrane protein (DUF4010 family)